MKQLIKNKRELPECALTLGLALLCNVLVYYGARLLATSWHHTDMTTPIDELIPFLPWTISIYWGCYLFWGVNYGLSALQSRAERNRFFCADILARLVCFVFFLLLPTTNIRPEVTGVTVWDELMRTLYSIDAADNLFPSIHCLASWICWIGVRRRTDIPAVYRHASLLIALLVCASTVTTKQHVIVDVFGGILLAEICYLIAGIPVIHAAFSKCIDFLCRVLHIQSKP